MSSTTKPRTALITGGTTGIGHASVRLVGSQGYSALISSHRETITGRVSLGRSGENDYVARAVAFLASPAAGSHHRPPSRHRRQHVRRLNAVVRPSQPPAQNP